MPHRSRPGQRIQISMSHRRRHYYALICSLFIVAALAVAASAQSNDVNPALKPPKGSNIAVVVFEDLQCPQCRLAAPVIRDAGKTYKIPIVRHDFPLPMHNWSGDAAIIAHYFDSKSKELGNAYRDYIFEHQPEIYPANLRAMSEKFAAEHKVELPFVVDPQGKFAAEIAEEKNLGARLGLNHTPTIYVVSNKPNKPYTEVTDRTQLFSTIDAVKSN